MNRITKNISISLDPTLLEQAKKRAAIYGFKHSFSAYIAFLINEDLDSEVEGEPHGFDLSGPQSGNGPKPVFPSNSTTHDGNGWQAMASPLSSGVKCSSATAATSSWCRRSTLPEGLGRWLPC